ncbi:DUF480 domain-containing protein [Planctomicrobium sp. SH527]|uniref:DUF480 domain-containing protein n=1 Tax=Planctomicrobium sp. SH527 TaxID=3448123 RepID=UPI003F5C74D3
MNGFDDEQEETNLAPIRELTKPQRRVLGVLVEKAYTVPESYPLTVKSVVAGSNQKSNRAPITNYTEDALTDVLEDLRSMGLIAVVHTESGRTERYRHYVRKRFPFSEPQLAIITELLLRGRQQMGELRARASRMVPIESQQELKKEIEGLLEQGYVQVDGPLDRRGVEIDHNFYLASEDAKMSIGHEPSHVPSSDVVEASPQQRRQDTSHSHSSNDLSELREANDALRTEVETLRQEVAALRDDLFQLRQSLGA